MARTQEERKAETRSRLLAAAADLFAHRGVHNTSTDAIAEAADRTSGAVYAHFGSKEGLLLALVADWEHEAATRTGDALADTAPGASRLAAVWDSFANAGPDADTWRLLEHELLLQASRNEEVADTLAARYRAARRSMGGAFVDWAEEAGTPLPRPAEPSATLALGLLLGLELQRRLDPTAVSDELATAGLALLLGLHPDDGPTNEPAVAVDASTGSSPDDDPPDDDPPDDDPSDRPTNDLPANRPTNDLPANRPTNDLPDNLTGDRRSVPT